MPPPSVTVSPSLIVAFDKPVIDGGTLATATSTLAEVVAVPSFTAIVGL
jgi:hypothetical protein